MLQFVVFSYSFCQTKTTTNAKSEIINGHPAWIMQGNIYEVNVVNLLSLEIEEIEPQISNLTIAQKKILDRETEIANLQRKVILLYEELRNRTSLAIS